MLEGLFPQAPIQSHRYFLLSWRFSTGGANMIVEEQEWKSRGEKRRRRWRSDRDRPQLPAEGTMRVALSPTQDGDARSGLFVPDARQVVSKFLEAGLTLLESLSSPGGSDGFAAIERGLSR
jgi:hypothetical protein